MTALEHEIIPALEAKYPLGQGRRLVMGASLGGLNAYLAWNRLPYLFAKAAFQCPAFFSHNPITDAQTRRTIAERMSASDQGTRRYRRSVDFHIESLKILAWAFEKDVTAADDWAQFDPAAAANDGVPRAPAYVVSSRDDQFKFSTGHELSGVGRTVLFEQVDDTHCVGVNTVGLARFLVRH